MEELLVAYGGPTADADSRADALAELERMEAETPALLYRELLGTMSTSGDATVRQLSAIVMRKFLLRNMEMDDVVEEEIKQAVLELLLVEPEDAVRNAIADAVASLASGLLPLKGWDGILHWLVDSMAGGDPSVQKCALRVLIGISEQNAAEHIGDALPQLVEAMAATMVTPGLRLSTSTAATALMKRLRSSTLVRLLQPLLPALISSISDLLAEGQEAVVRAICTHLVYLGDERATVFRDYFDMVVEAMLALAHAEDLEAATRHSALELLLVISKGDAERCRKVADNEFVKTVVPLALQLMLTIDEDSPWDWDVNSDEILDHDVGLEAISRLVVNLGSRTTLPVVVEHVNALLEGDEWQPRASALMAISMVSNELMEEDVTMVVGLCIERCEDEHARVRFAAVSTLGQLSLDHGPVLQRTHHATVMPAMMALLADDEEHVVAQACAAMINFLDLAHPRTMGDYLDDLTSALFDLLGSGTPLIQEQVVTTLGTIATHWETGFVPYYDEVMPLLLELLHSTPASTGVTDLAQVKLLETIGLIGMGVSKDGCDKFFADAEVVINWLNDNPVTDERAHTAAYIQSAWSALCTALGEAFAPYLDMAMPMLLKAAQQQTDAEVDAAVTLTEVAEELGDDDSGLASVPVGRSRQMVVRTDVIGDKINAVRMIALLASEQGEHFFPYIRPTLDAVGELTMSMFDDLREPALAIMASLVLSAYKYTSKVDESAADEAADVFVACLKNILADLDIEDGYSELGVALNSLRSCVWAASARGDVGSAFYVPVFNDVQLDTVMRALAKVVQDSFTRRAVMIADAKAAALYDEDSAELDEMLVAEEAKLVLHVNSALGTVQQAHGEATMPLFKELFEERMFMMVEPDSIAADIKNGLFFMDDVFEHCQPAALDYLPAFMPVWLAYSDSDDMQQCQAAVFGLNLAARHCPPDVFAEYGEQVVEQTMTLLAACSMGDRTTLTDNVVSTLGSICRRQLPEEMELWTAWLEAQPLTRDVAECHLQLRMLCELAEEEHAALSDDDGLRHLLRIFGDVLGTVLVPDDVPPRLHLILANLAVSNGAALEAAWAALHEEAQDALAPLLDGVVEEGGDAEVAPE